MLSKARREYVRGIVNLCSIEQTSSNLANHEKLIKVRKMTQSFYLCAIFLGPFNKKLKRKIPRQFSNMDRTTFRYPRASWSGGAYSVSRPSTREAMPKVTRAGTFSLFTMEVSGAVCRRGVNCYLLARSTAVALGIVERSLGYPFHVKTVIRLSRALGR